MYVFGKIIQVSAAKIYSKYVHAHQKLEKYYFPRPGRVIETIFFTWKEYGPLTVATVA